MKIKGKYLERSAYIWIFAAIVIFAVGFLKPYLAIIASIAIGAALYKVFTIPNDTEFFVGKKMFVSAGIIIILWMILCGQEGIVFQPADWNGRNAQLEDLVAYTWPVYYSDGSAFTYYIGHFLVPALIGKMFGLGAARVALMIYTTIGVYIIWLYIVKITNANNAIKQTIVLLLLIFFSQADNLHNIVSNFFNSVFSMNAQKINFGFTNNSSSFACVFNQITCAFLVLCIFFDDDTKVENFIVLGVPMLLFSPFMLCGVFVLVAAATVKQIIHYRKNILIFAKKLFSVQNLCIAIVIFPILLLYLSGNIFSPKPDSLKFSFVSYSGRISVYILFVLFEFLIYSILLYPSNKKNVYFYVANAILLILPFCKMGVYNDFVTRISSIGLFVIMIMSAEMFFEKSNLKSFKVRQVILCLLIITAAIPKMNEYISYTSDFASSIASGNFKSTWRDDFKTYEGLSERFDGDDLKYGYYTFDAKEHFFFKYMARK